MKELIPRGKNHRKSSL